MNKEKETKEDFGENFPLKGIPKQMRLEILRISKKQRRSINAQILILLEEGLNYFNTNN